MSFNYIDVNDVDFKIYDLTQEKPSSSKKDFRKFKYNRTSESIQRAEFELLKQKIKTGKSYNEMIDEVEAQIHVLDNEEEELRQQRRINYDEPLDNITHKCKKLIQQRNHYDYVIDCYNDWIEQYKRMRKADALAMVGTLVVYAAISVLVSYSMLFALIPMALGYGIYRVICNKKQNRRIKRYKLKHFGSANITDSDMNKSIEKSINESELKYEALLEEKRPLIKGQQEMDKTISQTCKKRDDLIFYKNLLNWHNQKSDTKTNYMDLFDQTTKSIDAMNQTVHDQTEQPKTFRKRYKIVGRNV